MMSEIDYIGTVCKTEIARLKGTDYELPYIGIKSMLPVIRGKLMAAEHKSGGCNFPGAATPVCLYDVFDHCGISDLKEVCKYWWEYEEN